MTQPQQAFAALLTTTDDKLLGVPEDWQWQALALGDEYRQHSKGLDRWLPRGAVAFSGIAGEGDNQVHARLIIDNQSVTAVVVAGLSAADRDDVLHSLEPLGRRGETWTERQAARNVVKRRDDSGETVWTRLNGLPNTAPAAWRDAFHFETKHFLLVGQVSPKRLLELSKTLEALDGAYRQVFNAKDDIAICKATVLIAKDFQSYAEISQHFKMNVGNPAGGGIINGYFNPSRILMVTYHDPLPNMGTTVEGVLAHECAPIRASDVQWLESCTAVA